MNKTKRPNIVRTNTNTSIEYGKDNGSVYIFLIIFILITTIIAVLSIK